MAKKAESRLQDIQKPPQSSAYKAIEDYGVIGDLHTTALVAKDGSIDWCCFPNFDSPAVFASILDTQKGGHFKISAPSATVLRQLYFPDTCILITRFLSPDGVSEILDFMPPGGESEEGHVSQIVRLVRCVKGTVAMELECFPAFNFAMSRHRLHITKGGAVFSSDGDETLGLTSAVPLQGNERGVYSQFTLQSGQAKTFLLRWADQKCPAKVIDLDFDCQGAFRETVRFWERWIEGCSYKGRWQEMVRRAAMTLKLLTFAPTGAVVAAPTTSLPETIGGGRNFDYRYTWIRDAAFTMYAFIRLGLTREADRFMEWIDARAHEENPDGSLQIMYSIHGEHRLPEIELKHLAGYRDSQPVRVGNAAYDQLQLDIYGELMDTVYLSNKYGKQLSYDLWLHLEKMLGYVCQNWHRKDEGIWEVRGGRHHFVSSRLMCWVALDRGLRLAQKRGFPADQERLRRHRDKIYKEIMARGWNDEKKSFVQHYDTDALDASNLLMPLVLFISPTDPRMQSTLTATLNELVSDSLVNRYQVEHGAWDGFHGEEGTFSICTFWLVECLTRAGRLEEARLIFEKMLSYANPLGLYSEQIGLTGEHLGNYPQAFTHLSLISSAYNLNRVLGE